MKVGTCLNVVAEARRVLGVYREHVEVLRREAAKPCRVTGQKLAGGWECSSCVARAGLIALGEP